MDIFGFFLFLIYVDVNCYLRNYLVIFVFNKFLILRFLFYRLGNYDLRFYGDVVLI